MRTYHLHEWMLIVIKLAERVMENYGAYMFSAINEINKHK
jgi:hypothetical protein